MSLPLLLAQMPGSVSSTLASELSVFWPIVVFLIGLAAAAGESRWRTSQTEKAQEKSDEKHTRAIAETKAEAAAALGKATESFALSLREMRQEFTANMKDFDIKHTKLQEDAGATKQEVAVLASILGEIKKSQENMERMLREALATRSP